MARVVGPERKAPREATRCLVGASGVRRQTAASSPPQRACVGYGAADHGHRPTGCRAGAPPPPPDGRDRARGAPRDQAPAKRGFAERATTRVVSKVHDSSSASQWQALRRTRSGDNEERINRRRGGHGDCRGPSHADAPHGDGAPGADLPGPARGRGPAGDSQVRRGDGRRPDRGRGHDQSADPDHQQGHDHAGGGWGRRSC